MRGDPAVLHMPDRPQPQLRLQHRKVASKRQPPVGPTLRPGIRTRARLPLRSVPHPWTHPEQLPEPTFSYRFRRCGIVSPSWRCRGIPLTPQSASSLARDQPHPVLLQPPRRYLLLRARRQRTSAPRPPAASPGSRRSSRSPATADLAIPANHRRPNSGTAPSASDTSSSDSASGGHPSQVFPASCPASNSFPEQPA